MPRVLWGVACLSLPRPGRAADVAQEFRESLSLGYYGPGQELTRKGTAQPRVDLYKLVPLADDVLVGEEQVVAHLPDSSFGCAEIEEVYRQRDDAELRYSRARESLMALASEGLEDVEEASPTLRRYSAPPSHRLGGGSCGSGSARCQEMVRVLQQENMSLRLKLQQSESINRELQETANLLQREFTLLVQEVQPPFLVDSPSSQESSIAAPTRCGVLGVDSPQATATAAAPSTMSCSSARCYGGAALVRSAELARQPWTPLRGGTPTAAGSCSEGQLVQQVQRASPLSPQCLYATYPQQMPLSARGGGGVAHGLGPAVVAGSTAATAAAAAAATTMRHPVMRMPLSMKTWTHKDAFLSPRANVGGLMRSVLGEHTR